MPVKKIPLRRCVGCGEGKPKKELVRIAHSKDGAITLDTTGRAPGRGAYLCPDADCLQKALKRKSLQRAFGCAVPDEVFLNLGEALCKAGTGDAQPEEAATEPLREPPDKQRRAASPKDNGKDGEDGG